MKLAVCGGDSRPGVGGFSRTGILFFAFGTPSIPGQRLRILDCFDLSPFMGGRLPALIFMEVCQPENIGLAEIGIAGATSLGNFNQAKRLQFANCWRYCVTFHAVICEIIKRHRQTAVFDGTVMHVLDLDAVKNAVG
jgi:hypothetical protein